MDDPEEGVITVNIPTSFLPTATKQNDMRWYSTLLGIIHKTLSYINTINILYSACLENRSASIRSVEHHLDNTIIILFFSGLRYWRSRSLALFSRCAHSRRLIAWVRIVTVRFWQNPFDCKTRSFKGTHNLTPYVIWEIVTKNSSWLSMQSSLVCSL